MRLNSCPMLGNYDAAFAVHREGIYYRDCWCTAPECECHWGRWSAHGASVSMRTEVDKALQT